MHKVVEVLKVDDKAEGVSADSYFEFSPGDLSALLSTTTDAISILEPVLDSSGLITDFKWVFTNAAAEKLFQSALIGKKIGFTYPEFLSSERRQAYIELLQNGLPKQETVCFQIDGETNWLDIHAARLRTFLLIRMRNINAEIGLKEKEERYRFMVESLPHLIWTCDKKGFTDFISPQFTTFVGASLDVILREGWTHFIHPEDMELIIDKWKRSIHEKIEFKAEHRMKNAQGEYRWFSSAAIPMNDPSGTVLKWFGSSTYIHEEKLHLEEIMHISHELEEKNDMLERVNNDLDTFVYTASHDLTAPINNIEGLTSLIRYELADVLNERQLEYLDFMTQSTSKLHANIKDLTEIIAIKQDTGLEKEAVFFSEILENIREDLHPVIHVLKAEIITDFKVTSILFARKNIRTILFNLISNALKYRSSDKLTQIFISTRREGQEIVLEVKDNGLGIAEEQLSQLFQIFKRFHTRIKGNGVGLYMIKRIIENNNGRIEVKSDLEKGTAFSVYFPA